MGLVYRKIGFSIFALFFVCFQAQNTKGLQEQRELSFQKKLDDRSFYNEREIQRLKGLGYKEIIEEGINVKQLIGADELGRPLYYTTLNAGAATMTKTPFVYNIGINGEGMTIGQWDYSKPRTTHELLAGKVNYASTENQTISRHSTNIAGTLVGNNGETEAKGISYGSTLKAFDWVNDVSEMNTEAYSETNEGGLLIANNSYGYDPLYLQTYQFGKYNLIAQRWDELMYLKPYFQIIKAAGNTRDIQPSLVPQVASKSGYDLLEGAGTSKNVLVIGSAKKNASMSTDEDYEVSSFSSYGPTDDGRIKPDLCAPGEEIYSSIETYDQGYGLYKGTSSATAVVSGVSTLLQQYYQSVHPEQKYMLSSTLRALLIHTANDKGSIGPDYIYGWGLVDAKRATQAIYNNIEGSTNNEKKTTLIKEVELTQGNQYILYVVPYDLSEPLSATIAWTDPQGSLPNNVGDNPQKNLVNDLDIKIIRVNNNGSESVYYPWKLGGMSDYLSPATKSTTNDVDNVERVDITPNQLSKTTYKIIISTKNENIPLLPNGKQVFSLVTSNVDFCYMDDLMVLSSPDDDISTSIIKKAKKIEATNKVSSPTQGVEYIASENIRLLPGFHAELGSGFKAYITPCFDIVSSMRYMAQKRKSEISDFPIDGGEKSDNFIVYPNPADQEINIKFLLLEDSKVTIHIYDSSGKIVFTQESTQQFPLGEFLKTINTQHLSSGMYLISLSTSQNQYTKKLIIK